MINSLKLVLLINLIPVIFYLHHHKKKPTACMAVFFLVLPIIGLLFYYIPIVVYQRLGGRTYDRETIVNRRLAETEASQPEVKTELDVIPICDAMAIGSNSEKRTLLLNQMKKDITKNYKSLLLAGKDSDSETVHYIAAAKMELYRRQQERLIAAKKAYEREQESAEKAQRYLSELVHHIESGILSEKEVCIYRRQFITVMETYLERFEKRGTSELEFSYYREGLFCYIKEKQYEKADHLWKLLPPREKEEDSYFHMLQLYYENGDKELFRQCLNELSSSPLELSAEGLKKLRFWRERRI